MADTVGPPEEESVDVRKFLAVFERYPLLTTAAIIVIGYWAGGPLGVLMAPVASVIGALLLTTAADAIARSRRAAWLQTPEGRAWQKAQQERYEKQQAEEERRRQEAAESAARARWRQFHESKSMDDISRMTGAQFEEFLARLFRMMGYHDITLTPPNDQGGDLLCRSPTGTLVVVQAKRWKGGVGNGAIQELLGAMLHYRRPEGMVVTNSRFTDAARDLAGKSARITLRDGGWLAEQIKKYLPPDIPDFSWEEYNRMEKEFATRRAKGNRRSRKGRGSGRGRWH